MSASPPIAVLSDSPSLHHRELESALRAEGLVPVRVSTVDDLFTLLREEPVEWLLLDFTQHSSLVEAVLPTVQQQREERFFPLFVVTNPSDEDERVRLLEQGAERVIPTGPALLRELLLHVRRLGAQRRLRAPAQAGPVTRVVHEWTAFLERLDEAFRRAQRYDEPLCVASIELRVTAAADVEPPGEAENRAMVTELGARLADVLRETDACGQLEVGRYGVLLPRTPMPGALTLAERIVRHMGAQRVGPGRVFVGEARVGLGGFPQRAVNGARVLLATSEQALLKLRTDERRRIAVAHEAARTQGH